jgi:ABC-type glutathione transport system ATPase component
MTIKMYESSYVSKGENARQRAVAEQVAIEFQEEFAAMCEKYKVEFSVRECNKGYQSYAEGIDVDFDGIYKDGETIRPYFTIEFSTTI